MRTRGRARRRLRTGGIGTIRLRASLDDAATLSVLLTLLNTSIGLGAALDDGSSMSAALTRTAPSSISLVTALEDGALMAALATITAPSSRSLVAALNDDATMAALLTHTSPGSRGLIAAMSDDALMAAALHLTAPTNRGLAAALDDGSSTVANLTHTTPDNGNNANTVLLLHMDGTNNSTTITDSAAGHTTAHNGTCAGAAKLSTTSPKFGTASLAVGATLDAVTFTTHADFNFGSGDYCIDFQMLFNALSGTQVIYDARPSGSNGNHVLLYVASGALNFFFNSSARITGGSFTTGTFYHVELSRTSGVTRLFVDGTQIGSNFTDANTYLQPGTGRPIIGLSTDGAATGLNGRIDEFRIKKGQGGHTSNFVAPTVAYS